MMRRILLLVTVAVVMAAMMVAFALPAMAAPGGGAQHHDRVVGDTKVSIVATPSGATNATVLEQPEGDNAGGTGGGGAIVILENAMIGLNDAQGNLVISDPDATIVSTPSGNELNQLHVGPTE